MNFKQSYKQNFWQERGRMPHLQLSRIMSRHKSRHLPFLLAGVADLVLDRSLAGDLLRDRLFDDLRAFFAGDLLRDRDRSLRDLLLSPEPPLRCLSGDLDLERLLDRFRERERDRRRRGERLRDLSSLSLILRPCSSLPSSSSSAFSMPSRVSNSACPSPLT